MRIKRHITLYVILCMLVSILNIPQVGAEVGVGDTSLNYAWLEAADMTKGGGSSLASFSSPTASDRVSGSDYFRVNKNTAPADTNGYYVDAPFSVGTEGSYDIFVRGSYLSYSADNASPVELSVDGTVYDDVTVVNSEGWINPNTSGSTTYPIGWQKITVNLTAQEHNFRWSIKTASTKGLYFGILDVVIVVPSGSGFEPTPASSISSAFPAKNLSDYNTLLNGTDDEESESSYIWLEETDASYNGFNRHFTVNGFSSGYAYGCNTETTPGSEGYYLEYDFSVPKAGEYIIWLHATQSDHAQASDAKIYVDTVLQTDEKYGADKWAGTTFVYSWRKITLNLAAGEHKIKYLIDTKETKTNKYYRGMLDCICIMPSDYLWDGPDISTRPYKPIYFEAEEYASTNWKNSGGSVITENQSMRGGKRATLYYNPSANTEYYIEYNVNMSESGYYRLDMASTPPQDSGWSSRIYASVNSGAVYDLDAVKADSSESSLSMYRCDSVYLNKGNNTIRFIVKDRVTNSLYVCQIDYFVLSLTDVSLDGIYSDNPYMVFESDKPVEIYVQANGFVPSDTTVSYSVTDYYGTEVKNGNAVISKGDRRGAIDLGIIKNGYYKVTAEYAGSTVTNDISVVIPLSQRSDYEDTPFALDVNFYALYNKYAENKVMLSEYVETLELAGIKWIRDRISLDDAYAVNDNGTVTVNASKNINIGNIIKGNSDIKISAVIDKLPSWIKSDYSEFGTDYTLIYNLFKALGDTLGNKVDCFEILNETDNGGGSGYDNNGADQYAAFLKAAAAGIADSASNAFIITQGNARYPYYTGKYPAVLYDNEIFTYAAADNYHSHILVNSDEIGDYAEFTGIYGNQVVDNLKKSYNSSVPVWITEAGYLIENPRTEDLDLNESRAQAKYLVTSTAESLASGVDKHFYFLGMPYDETASSTGITYTCGIMNKNTRFPAFYPSYSAMSAMTYVLGEGQYIGKIPHSDVCAYAFKDGEDTVLVLYTTGSSQSYEIDLSCTQAEKYDIFGNMTALQTDDGVFTLNLSSEPVYLRFTGDIDTVIDTSYADELISPVKPILSDADKIVISQKYSDTSKKEARRKGYYIDSTNKTVTVTVTNLNNTSKDITVSGYSNNGWTLSPASQTVSVEPFASKDMTFTINTDEYYSKIYFKGMVDGEETTSSCVYAYGGFAGVDFVDGDGMHLYTLTADSDNYAKVIINNKTSLSKKSIDVYVAAYDEMEENLLSVSKTSVTANMLSLSEELVKVNPVQGASVYKVYLWNSSLTPYAAVHKLNKN
ncbi:MAG: hypothetical protein J6D26_00605 [Clostridia bacterium]|nr:hypothetical protein [Clostridia bacterium]